MAPGVEDARPRAVAPADWIPITAVQKDNAVDTISNVYVPRHWIPESALGVVVCRIDGHITREVWFERLPDYVRLIFGCICWENREDDPDYNEIFEALVECGAIDEEDEKENINEDVLDVLPTFNLDTLPQERVDEHVVVVFTNNRKVHDVPVVIDDLTLP